MRFWFQPEALAEYSDAIRYYQETGAELAAAFIEEIEHAVRAIRRNPDTWRLVEGDVRRYLVHRFPFGIYYTLPSHRKA